MEPNKVKALLQRHGRNKALAAVLEEKARHLRSVLYAPSSASLSEGRGGKTARGVDDRLVRVEQLEEEAARHRAEVNMVELALSVLDEEELRVAELCFLAPKMGNGKLLCEELHKERTAVFRLSVRVLEKLAGVLWVAEIEE